MTNRYLDRWQDGVFLRCIWIRMTLWVPFTVLHTSREYVSSHGDPVVLNLPGLLKFRSIAGDTLLTCWSKHYMLTLQFFSIIWVYSFIFHALHCYILNLTAAQYNVWISHTGRVTACNASILGLIPDCIFSTHVYSAFGGHKTSLPNINYSFIYFCSHFKQMYYRWLRVIQVPLSERTDTLMKVTDITQELGISLCGLHSIVHDHLDYRKLCAGSQRTSLTITKLIMQDSVLSFWCYTDQRDQFLQCCVNGRWNMSYSCDAQNQKAWWWENTHCFTQYRNSNQSHW